MIGGSTVDVVKINSETALDALPPKVYIIRHATLRGYYLEISKDKLELPEKLYGTIGTRADKCLQTYTERPRSTGILMTGFKGTGKSLLMSLLANKAIEDLALPVILVKQGFAGTEFTSFIEKLGECCLVFDEFGKMYTKEQNLSRHPNEVASESGSSAPSQQALLSLMDGVDKTKRLIIITENSEWDINEFVLNRPSRVYYHFRYRKLDEASIVDYCNDFNVNKDIIAEILDVSRRSKIFSFDMLQSIIEEHNRFGNNVNEIIEDLNIDVREDIKQKLQILKVIEVATGKERELRDTDIVDKPEGRHDYTYINLKPEGKRSRNDENDDCSFYIKGSNLAFESKGKEVYETNDYKVVAKPLPVVFNDYSPLF